jgi:hypothetical protein
MARPSISSQALSIVRKIARPLTNTDVTPNKRLHVQAGLVLDDSLDAFSDKFGLRNSAPPRRTRKKPRKISGNFHCLDYRSHRLVLRCRNTAVKIQSATLSERDAKQQCRRLKHNYAVPWHKLFLPLLREMSHDTDPE